MRPFRTLAHDLTRIAAALSGVGVLVASTSVAAETGSQTPHPCVVEFSRISEVRYNPTLNLFGSIIMGTHNFDPSAKTGGARTIAFEALDSDGFLTLVILLNHWRSSGLSERNQTRAVAVTRADLTLAKQAAERGVVYHRVLLDQLNNDDTPPANIDDVRRLLSLKLSGMEILVEGLDGILAASTDQQSVQVPAGFLTARLTSFVDRLVPPGESLFVQYLDRAAGVEPNGYCSETAASAFVGQVLCGFRFSTGERRDPAFCPSGLSVAPLATVQRCRRVNNQDQC